MKANLEEAEGSAARIRSPVRALASSEIKVAMDENDEFKNTFMYRLQYIYIYIYTAYDCMCIYIYICISIYLCLMNT